MQVAQDSIFNIAVQDHNLRKEAWHNSFWNKFSGVGKSIEEGGKKLYQPSGKPIEILNQLVEEGRDNLMLPLIRDLTGAYVIGETTLKGTGEEQTVWHLRCYINQIRKAVMAQSGNMSQQRVKLYNLKERARPSLAKYFGKVFNQECARSFYEGISLNLSKSNADEGLGLYKRYHPNFYVNDGGVITAVAGTEGQTCSATELDTAVGNADTVFNGAMLLDLSVKVQELSIAPIVMDDGFEFWPILAHPKQLISLFKDVTDYTPAAAAAYRGLAGKYPLINAAMAYYAGFAIYQDIASVRGWDDANGGFFEDDDADPMATLFDPTSITDNKCAIVFGNQAIGRAVAEKMYFTTEDDDHGAIKEIGASEISGFNRADYGIEADAGEVSGDLFYKNTTGGVANGLTVLNQSSLIIMTKE